MGKFKFKFSDFNEKTGKSHVCLEYKGKDYHGYAYYNDTDRKEYPPSSFLGCRIAERRAYVKALEVELKEKKVLFKHYQDCLALIADAPEETWKKLADKIDAVYADIQYREKIIERVQKNNDIDIDNFVKFQKKKESCE
jgi:hypothetical protein